MSEEGNPVLAAALSYAAMGWPVAPAYSIRPDGTCTCGRRGCGTIGANGKVEGSPGKHPITQNGLKDATTDLPTIRGWWAKYPDANVLIRTGKSGDRHLIALDIDLKPDRAGDESLAVLIAEHGALPNTPTALTGGGGQHLFFWSNVGVPNSVDKLGSGIDIRGEGGYVVAAPSRHISGKEYTWESSAHPADIPLAEAPDWLIRAAGRYRSTPPARLADGGLPDFIIGGRNKFLTTMAGHLRRPGFGFTAILRAIQETNETRCKPPLEDDEVRNIVSSVVRNYQPGAPVAPEPHTSDLFPTINAHDMMTPDGPIPWVCEGLKIAPGAVTIVGGAGFGGKTITLQALAVAVATGAPFLGRFATRKGRVLHLDYEQGKRLTKARYRRLAAASGIQLLDCDKDDLRCAVLPAALSSAKANEHLTALADGCTLCIVDAFRGAFPVAKENDSEARSWLDMLSRISDDSGCAMVVIMHARKTVTEDGGDRAALRGSSALFDAAQCVWMLNGTKGKPTKVVHEKERNEGVLLDSFGISVSDVAREGDPRWGLALDFVDGPDLEAAYLDPQEDDHVLSAEASLALLATGIERAVALVSHSDLPMPRSVIAASMPVSTKALAAILDTAVQRGALFQEGQGPNAYYKLR